MTVTFNMWSPFHYFMMIFPFVLAFILYLWFYKKKKREQQFISIVLSTVMVIIFIMRSINMIVKHDGLNPEVFPFQVCHMANFVFFIAAITKNKVWGTIAWVLNFPAGLVSLIFADGLENYTTIMNIQGFAYIAGHMLIVTTGMYMLLMRQIVIQPKSLRLSIIIVGFMYMGSVIVNNLFNRWFAETGVISNYFYTWTPERGTPLETMFNAGKNLEWQNFTFNPIYLLLLGLVGLIVMFTMYGVYRLREFVYRRLH